MIFDTAVILYNPDRNVYDHINRYLETSSKVLLYDNSERKTFDFNQLIKPENVIYYTEHKNKGMACALNYIFKWAQKENCDFILTMDQDSEYSVKQIKNMQRYIENHYSDRAGIYAANYAKIYHDKNGDVHGPYILKDDEVRVVPTCMTSTSFVNVKCLKDLPELEDWFISVVDTNFSAMLTKKGYKNYLVGCSKFEQEIGHGVNNTFFNRLFHVVHHSNVRYYYMIRNLDYFIDKYTDDKTLKKIGEIQKIRIVGNIVFENEKIAKIKACKRGKADYKRGVLGKYPGGDF